MENDLLYQDVSKTDFLEKLSQPQHLKNGLISELQKDSSTDLQRIESLANGLAVSGTGFFSLIAQYGLFRVLKSYVFRIRYIVALWLMRESAITTVLVQNFEKIPKGTYSKAYAKLARSLNLAKMLNGLSAMINPVKGMKILSVNLKTVNKSY